VGCGVTFARAVPINLNRDARNSSSDARRPQPIDGSFNPTTERTDSSGKPVNDRVYARRVYLDALGLLPRRSESTLP